jgi:hypothetical protein
MVKRLEEDVLNFSVARIIKNRRRLFPNAIPLLHYSKRKTLKISSNPFSHRIAVAIMRGSEASIWYTWSDTKEALIAVRASTRPLCILIFEGVTGTRLLCIITTIVKFLRIVP